MQETIEVIILNKLLTDEQYLRKVIPFIQGEYFTDAPQRLLFEAINAFVVKYNALPSKEALKIDFKDDKNITEQDLTALDTLLERTQVPIDVNEKWLLDSTETFCKDKAVYNAIVHSIHVLDGRDKINSKDGKKISGKLALIGEFNLDNLLLAVALASSAGPDEVKISSAIAKLSSVPGRLEQIKVGQGFTALVDYAQTPDAVSRVLEIARKITNGKVIAVLGCGGDRDVSKRPLMGQALFTGSDIAVFTSDNP